MRVPSPEDEAVRDPIRACEDLGEDILGARHRLSKFLLRHGRIYDRGKKWTKRHHAWLQQQRFELPLLDGLLGHLIAQVQGRVAQREALERDIEQLAGAPQYGEAVARLSCLRGISTFSALTLLVEVGDFRRFRSAPALMAFTGLVASEDSSGERRRQGSITKTGNAHLRRVLAYVLAAQGRLHTRYWRLVHRGKPTVTASVAVARELRRGLMTERYASPA